MATCFFFVKQIDESERLSLRLSSSGQVEEPLALRSQEELRKLQENARTIVVLPASMSSLHQVNLPKLNASKARAAIPYALEEELAQSITDLHFAFDVSFYQNGSYLVAVMEKALIRNLIEALEASYLNFDAITLDWFALEKEEAIIMPDVMLVHDESFQGALSEELALIYLQSKPDSTDVICFPDSHETLVQDHFIQNKLLSYVWVAQRLLQTDYMDLCQGDIQQKSKARFSSQIWYFFCGILGIIWLFTLLLTNLIELHFLNAEMARLDKQVADIYHEFFPQAQQVITPRFRISQLLKEAGDSEDRALWILLTKLAQAFKSGTFSIEQLRYQNQILLVTFTSPDFAALEAFQQQLRQQNITVRQTQASSKDNQVYATLELHL